MPCQWLDTDNAARELVMAATADASHLPIVLLSDGASLVQPSARELAAEIGLQTKPLQAFYDLVVVGGGPAGLAGSVDRRRLRDPIARPRHRAGGHSHP